MRRCRLLGALVALACGLACSPPAPTGIVLIVADDLGWGDLGAHGSRQARTPNIDRLAREGVRFTNAYAASSICAPSRAALMTGRYPQRFGYTGPTGPPGAQLRTELGVPLGEVMLPVPLAEVGYTSAAVGKWHLGMTDAHDPLSRGFDEFFGFRGGGHGYFGADRSHTGALLRNREKARSTKYLTHTLTDEAVAFIERQAGRPFFLYVAYNAVHPPFQAPERYLEPYADLEPWPRPMILAMLAALDEGVGRILAALDETGRAEDTLVLFTSDHGAGGAASDNGPFRGAKGGLHEGGIRVPLLARWPAKLAAGSTFDEPASGIDLFPTLVAAAGGRLPEGVEIDGRNLLPALTGGRSGAPPPLFWSVFLERAMRRGDMKLIVGWNRVELYDVAADPGETRNLADERPELVAELRRELRDWSARIEPRAPSFGEGGGAGS